MTEAVFADAQVALGFGDPGGLNPITGAAANPITDRWYDLLPAMYRAADDADTSTAAGWPLYSFMDAVCSVLTGPTTTANRIADGHLTDPAVADDEWVPWLAQVVGVYGVGVQQQRARLARLVTAPALGSARDLEVLTQEFLTGTKSVQVRALDPWAIQVRVRADELTLPGITTAGDLAARLYATGGVPAGFAVQVTTEQQTWQQVQIALPTWLPGQGKSWALLESLGLAGAGLAFGTVAWGGQAQGGGSGQTVGAGTAGGAVTWGGAAVGAAPAAGTITPGNVTANLTGTTVALSGSITTTQAVTFDGLNISIAKDQAGYPWVASVGFANGSTVAGTRALSGSTTLAAGNYVAYVSYSLDGQVTWITGPKVQFSVAAAPAGTGYVYPEISIYCMRWSNSSGPLSQVPAKANSVRLAFATMQTGVLALTGWGPEGQSATLSSLATLRARGCKIIISIGGAGYPIDLSNTSARVADMVAISSSLGGIDGFDVDLEASGLNQSQVVAFAQACKAQFGSNFAITMAPNGSNVGQYLPVAVALHNAGCLDSYGHQFYDAPVSLAAAKGRIQEAINAGLPPSKIAVGMMIASGANWWTNTQCLSYMQDIKATWPAIQRAYLWENSRAGTLQWANDMASVFGI